MKRQDIELFPKKYGAYFTDRAVEDKGCPILKMVLRHPFTKGYYDGETEGYLRYVEAFRSTYADLEKAVYAAALKVVWLEHRFGMGQRNMANAPTDAKLATELRFFLERTCMVHRGLFFTPKASLLTIIRRFADDLHPGFFEVLDPFRSELKFPFETVRLGYLVTVSDMDEAMGLLQEAETRRLNYNEFLDFLANWVACHNEKYGEKYQLKISTANNMQVHVSNLLDGAVRSDALVLPVT